ncbi:unnamed protein product [Mytilus coruscus]|uniref:LRRCT domain-containing protein n=1 Tax=Mytilus coruscus TaxID=42192 RepID=A0A6J8C9V3_MYTCO|nr:unnamed protein product [Mytilus coruscus]
MNFGCILILLYLPGVLSNPVGCSYDASNVLYTCNARYWSLPLVYSAFTVQPQRIVLEDVAGELPATAPNGPTFSGFSSTNAALFDGRFSPSLQIMCFVNSDLIIFMDTFADFDWIDEVIITDCNILSLPVQVFAYFGDVNSFIIEGGSITNMVANSFQGLNVKKITSAPTLKGSFTIRNSQITSGQLAPGALFNINNATTIILENNHITTIGKDTFQGVPQLYNLTLSYNDITSIPESIFENLHALEHVTIWGVQWDCKCSNLWFLIYASNNNITFNGDIVCSTPAGYTNTRASLFYQNHCVFPCDGKIGFHIGKICITALDVVNFATAFLILVLTIFGFGIIMYLHCKEKNEEERIEKVRGIRNVMADKIAGILRNKINKIEEFVQDNIDVYREKAQASEETKENQHKTETPKTPRNLNEIDENEYSRDDDDLDESEYSRNDDDLDESEYQSSETDLETSEESDICR